MARRWATRYGLEKITRLPFSFTRVLRHLAMEFRGKPSHLGHTSKTIFMNQPIWTRLRWWLQPKSLAILLLNSAVLNCPVAYYSETTPEIRKVFERIDNAGRSIVDL